MLGKGVPGGSWHRMDPNLRTLSLSAWMSLPGLDFNTWDAQQANKNTTDDRSRRRKSVSSINQMPKLHGKSSLDHKPVDIQASLSNDNSVSSQVVPNQLPRRILSVKRQQSREVQTRALVSRVAEYYEDYVRLMKLDRFFCNDTLVTTIKPIHGQMNRDARWLVSGVKSNGSPFSYTCRNVVMANGAADLANRLGLRDENSSSAWIKHDLPQLESALAQVPDDKRSSE